MKYKDREDSVIGLLALAAIVALFTFWIFRDSPELFDGGDELYDYGVNLIIGVIVSYIFFHLNFLIPKKKRLKHSFKYIGECIGTICFNEITRVRTFEENASNLKVMNIMGVRSSYINGIKESRVSIQADINKQNMGLLHNLLDIADKNTFSSRTVVVELVNALFPMISENYMISDYFRDWKHEKNNQMQTLSCKRYSEGNIGYVTNAAIKRLNYLLENESVMKSINLPVEYGEG